jgi:hypothetical protein
LLVIGRRLVPAGYARHKGNDEIAAILDLPSPRA